jgi:hypothetical protein
MPSGRPGAETLSKPITRDGGESSPSRGTFCNRLGPTLETYATHGNTCITKEPAPRASKPKGSDPGAEKMRDVGGCRQRIDGAGPGRGHRSGGHRELDVVVG